MRTMKSNNAISTNDTTTAALDKMFTEIGIKQATQAEFEEMMDKLFNRKAQSEASKTKSLYR